MQTPREPQKDLPGAKHMGEIILGKPYRMPQQTSGCQESGSPPLPPPPPHIHASSLSLGEFARSRAQQWGKEEEKKNWNNSFVSSFEPFIYNKTRMEKPRCTRMYANQQNFKRYSKADSLPGDGGINTYVKIFKRALEGN